MDTTNNTRRAAITGQVYSPLAAGVAAHSHYLDPIAGAGLRGRSRNWGDADAAVKQEAAAEIIRQAQNLGMNTTETAFALAVAKLESGFNPDAAATTTSASGIGQLIDRTGAAYGLNSENRFDAAANVRSMLGYLRDCLNQARSAVRGQMSTLAKAYALYHDGPSLQYGGEDLAWKKIIPWTRQYLESLNADIAQQKGPERTIQDELSPLLRQR